MSAILHKRRYNALEEPQSPKCSPGRILFLSSDEARRKRIRHEQMGATAKALGFDVKEKHKKQILKPRGGNDVKSKQPADNHKRNRGNEMDTEEDQQQSKRIRRPADFKDTSESSKPPNPFSSKDVNVDWRSFRKNGKKLFTEEQVAKIVRDALAVQKEKLQEEYNKILQERLAVQFENFTQFNHDYVYRQLKSRNCNYIL
uniref:Uncharacterized protein n=1 Tax=Lotharella oceanica TaxID=641309 RepID=A0A7S2TQ46_9EUKA|mmetsp:Transcript_24783/g.46307  ORF Transcript_24783/g.46307 Transcript_24783/m.46307 type:complete len:201 (+) Transcript_24783:80-682(+)|eukprot:CAMPEP_0170180196 /NCGR_PEP_ID=MMETSP0040_2-20121228/20975_1 /TAXON_ID=641309 /ORGANISM="Lotharella oceanica, Strain CCMP622" /LENGTH=200 /DNA_ID=CAMNT_0010424723 /DNA_START=54 /DNA_END=656 /DNA_ORIENTATION=+